MNRLPKAYLTSAYFTLDNKAWKDYYQEPQSATDMSENCYINGESSNDFVENFQDKIPYKKIINKFNVLGIEGIIPCIFIIQELLAFQKA